MLNGCESITMLSEVETGQNDRPTIPVVIHSATVVSYPGLIPMAMESLIQRMISLTTQIGELTDSDGDGVGDNTDEFPFDAN